ncbi:MAG: YbfB/YjiJ family MFS transporter, partial [Pseudonocardiaceae bacterium]
MLNRDTISACLLLVVAMGFGRFAYTAMYPLMVRDGMITVEDGSIAASANYAGYLAGALAMVWARPPQAAYLCRVGSIATLVCLAAMAPDFPSW